MGLNEYFLFMLTQVWFGIQEHGGCVLVQPSSSSTPAKPASSQPTSAPSKPEQPRPVDVAEFRVVDAESGDTIYQDSTGRVYVNGRYSSLGKSQQKC